jgi:hypothetical protein
LLIIKGQTYPARYIDQLGGLDYRSRKMVTATFAFVAGFSARVVMERVRRQLQRRRLLARLDVSISA